MCFSLKRNHYTYRSMQTSTLYKAEYLRKDFKDNMTFYCFWRWIRFSDITKKNIFLKKENKILYIIQQLDLDHLKWKMVKVLWKIWWTDYAKHFYMTASCVLSQVTIIAIVISKAVPWILSLSGLAEKKTFTIFLLNHYLPYKNIIVSVNFLEASKS